MMLYMTTALTTVGAGLHIDPHTSRCRWLGEKMDYSMAIEGMYCLEERAHKVAGAATHASANRSTSGSPAAP